MARAKKGAVKSTLGKMPIVSTLNLYSRLFTAWRTKGRMDVPERNSLGKDKIFYSSNRLYTTKGVKMPFFIHRLPVSVNKGVITDLRNDVLDEIMDYNVMYDTRDTCKVNFITLGEHYNLDFSNYKTQGRIRHWSKREQKVMNELEAGNTLEDELNSDKHNLDTVRMVKSYRLMMRLKEEKAAFFKTKFIIELEATSDEALEVGRKVLSAWTFRNEIDVKGIFFQSNEYYMSYSPLGNNKLPRKSMLRKMNPGDVYPDEILNNMSVLTHGGTIGDRLGVPHGIDIFSRSVFSLDVSKGTDANNFLLTAMTGQGKSVFMKSAIFYYDLMGYSTVILDYEGDEYTYLAALLGANRVSISGGSSQYVNTLEISGLTGDDDIDMALYEEAHSMTENVFNILMTEDDRPTGMRSSHKALFDELVDRVYRQAGVIKKDPTTWHNSKKCTYYTLYDELLKIASKKSTTYGRFKKEDVNEMVNVLGRYFEEKGARNHYFVNPISVGDLLDNKHLVFSFGMKGQDSESTDSTSLALRQLFVSYLTMMKANYNKSRGKKTVIILEELQRYLEQPQSTKVVAGFASGGRKRGMVIYYITNSPDAMMSARDMVDESIRADYARNMKTIVDNLTMHIIGALPRVGMETMIERYDLEDATPHLLYLSDVVHSQGGHPFKHAFFIKYKGQSTVIRAVCHPELIKLPIFSTTIEQDMDLEDDDGIKLEYGDMSDRIRNARSAKEVIEDDDYMQQEYDKDFSDFKDSGYVSSKYRND